MFVHRQLGPCSVHLYLVVFLIISGFIPCMALARSSQADQSVNNQFVGYNDASHYLNNGRLASIISIQVPLPSNILQTYAPSQFEIGDGTTEGTGSSGTGSSTPPAPNPLLLPLEGSLVLYGGSTSNFEIGDGTTEGTGSGGSTHTPPLPLVNGVIYSSSFEIGDGTTEGTGTSGTPPSPVTGGVTGTSNFEIGDGTTEGTGTSTGGTPPPPVPLVSGVILSSGFEIGDGTTEGTGTTGNSGTTPPAPVSPLGDGGMLMTEESGTLEGLDLDGDSRALDFDRLVDSEGSWLLGVFRGSLSFGSVMLESDQGNDIFIARFDRQGNLLWATSLVGSGDEELQIKRVCANGDLLIGGSFSGSLESGSRLESRGLADGFVMRVSESGEFLWTRQLASRGYTQIMSLQETEDSDVVVQVRKGNGQTHQVLILERN